MSRVVGTLVRGLTVFTVVVGFVAGVTAADLSGKWRMTIEMEVGRATPLLELVQKDAKLTGTYTGRYGSSPVEGTVEDKKVSFTVSLESTALSFTGEVKDDGTLGGTATFGELGQVAWTAAREK